MAKKENFTQKELMLYVWHKVGKTKEAFLEEITPKVAMNDDGTPKVDDEGYVMCKMSDLEMEVTENPTIVREYLKENGIDQGDWLVMGIDKKFDPDMVDYLKCDPIVPKKEVWNAFCAYEHQRKLAKQRLNYLRAKSREAFKKAKRTGDA